MPFPVPGRNCRGESMRNYATKADFESAEMRLIWKGKVVIARYEKLRALKPNC